MKHAELHDVWSGPGGYKEILRIAWPLFFLSASTVVMQFCDRKFLGNSSTEEIVATLSAGNLLATLGTFFICMLSYSNPLTAQFFGAGRKDKCVDVLWSSFRAALLCAGAMLILLPALGVPLLLLTLSDATLSHAVKYFIVQIPGQVMLCLAAPSGFQRRNNSLKFTSIILLVGTLGQIALATTTISLSITMVSFMPLIALTESTLILSGQSLRASGAPLN